MRGIVAVSALALVCSVSTLCEAQAVPGDVAPPALRSVKTLALHNEMRRLWSDNVIWTRMYIVTTVDNDGSANAALARLMKNQEDIGNTFRLYYGDAPAGQLTGLLKEHITISGELLAAVMAGDTTKQAEIDKRWHENAVALATLLSTANPNWPRATMIEMLDKHIELTTRASRARVKKDWTDDVEAFDAVFTQAMEMSDALSDGIIRQFPTKV